MPCWPATWGRSGSRVCGSSPSLVAVGSGNSSPPGPGGRDAVETAARYACGQAGERELRRAAAQGAALVDEIRRCAAEGLFGGQAIRVFGTFEEYAAMAAWGCTFSGSHPARKVPGYAREVALRRYQKGNRGRRDVWVSRAPAEGGAAVVDEREWQLAELRMLVGNPFRSTTGESSAPDVAPKRP